MIRKSILFFFIPFTFHAQAQENAGVKPKFIADSVIAPTSLKYGDPSFLKRFIMGKNYREEWSTPIKAPVFRLSTSGFKIKEMGGGQQTKSLKLTDKAGKEWALRSLDKDVTLALPKGLRGTLAQKVTQDMISAAHPHAAVVVGDLAKAAKVAAPAPKLYYVVSDPAMGELDSLFANTFCWLEERHPTPDRSKTEDTDEVLEEIIEENDHLVLQKEVLKARLLDMLVADWDRHADQWAWGEIDSADKKFYYAIPRDRDQAFFYSRGALLSVVRLFALRHMVGFKSSTKKVKSLNYKAWNFDRTFINELNEAEWAATIREFQAALPDAVIEAAVRKIPAEAYAISGHTIEKKLKDRRDGLSRDAMRYYHFLSQQLTVNGTAQKEKFKVEEKNGMISITVTDNKNNEIYQRLIDPKKTRLIYLNGLDDKDHFSIGKNLPRSAKLIIQGGKGEDTYDLQEKIRGKIYEFRSDKSVLENQAKKEIKYLD
jgi:hypothetical protein